jgi:hypothetical protein
VYAREVGTDWGGGGLIALNMYAREVGGGGGGVGEDYCLFLSMKKDSIKLHKMISIFYFRKSFFRSRYPTSYTSSHFIPCLH